MADEKPTGLFGKILKAGEAQLDMIIAKSKADALSAVKNDNDIIEDPELYYRKSINKDMTYQVGTGGFLEKTNKLSYFYLRQMSTKDSVISAIIQTYQNLVSAHSGRVKTKYNKGFMIVPKNEQKLLEEIMLELFGNDEDKSKRAQFKTQEERSKYFLEAGRVTDGLKEDLEFEIQNNPDLIQTGEPSPSIEEEEEHELNDHEKMRLAKKILYKRIQPQIDAITEIIEHCGYKEHKPFDAKMWNFNSMLRALVRDSLTYDQIAIEIIPDYKGELSYYVPVDGGTIRYATVDLKNFKNINDANLVNAQNYDILFPEEDLKGMLMRDAVELDPQKVEEDQYKYVQVIDGRVERAFTSEELAFGMRNLTTDLWANNYSISELELLLRMVSSHLFTENFNHQYFVNGFAGKGIFHIKGNLPTRKLESFRNMWQHMVKGNRNSFQTPIISGPEEVKWIPVDQQHNDMEFNLWLQYLIKIMCSMYQIDPLEIGLGMREMGDGGGALSGDNSQVKLTISRTKGLVPMLTFLANFININIIDKINPDFKLEFVGISDESSQDALERQLKEVTFKKTVNEIREEDNLPPIPGMDELILNPTFLQFYNQFSPHAQKLQAENQEKQLQLMQDPNFQGEPDEEGEKEESQSPKNKPKYPFQKK